MDKEVIFAEDVERIFGKRPWASRSEEILSDSEPIEKENETVIGENEGEETTEEKVSEGSNKTE